MDSMVTGVDQYLKSGMLPYYYFVVVLMAVIVFFKYHSFRLTMFVIFIFWEGLFVYLGKQIFFGLYEIYKVGLVVLAFGLFYRNIRNNSFRGAKKINLIFLLLTLSFWISFLINNQPLITNLSQYGKKILLPYLFFYGIFSEQFTPRLEYFYSKLIRDILIIQVLLSFLKLLLFGFGESLVGSISFIGGGDATIIPILGFLFLWIKSPSKLKQKEWILILGMFLIALASNKRAPVFIVPLLIVAMYVYVNQSRTLTSFIKYVPLFMLLTYLGVRTNPTLNPQGSRWGSFDLKYVIQYVSDYTFGSEKARYVNQDISFGRGASLIALFSRTSLDLPIKTLFFGRGITEILNSYDEFDSKKYGISSKGALNGAFIKFISLGVLGLIFHLILGIAYISVIQTNRLKNLLIIIFLWDLFLYSGILLQNSALAIFTIYNIRIYTISSKKGSSER